MDATNVIGLMTAGVITLIWWDNRKTRQDVSDIRRDVTHVVSSHHKCREELPRIYASRDELQKLGEDVRVIDRDVAGLKTRERDPR